MSTSDRIQLATAFATIVLALVTAWLAWATYRVTNLVNNEVGLEHTVFLYRQCATTARSEARDGDALFDLRSDLPEGYEYNDRLSRDDLLSYLSSNRIDYVRCQIVNRGKLPILKIQISFKAQFYNHSQMTMVTSPLAALSADPLAADSKINIWFVNTHATPVTISNPNRVSYTTVDKKPIIEQLEPRLNDSWTVTKDKDVREHLDQAVMKDF